jgi:hypothetical protein
MTFQTITTKDLTMATKPLRAAGKKKQPAAVETSSSIENQVQAFLKSGGKIEKINSGVSGQSNMPAQKVKSSA